MDSIWKEKQLGLLGSSESIFKYIPDELGNILYWYARHEYCLTGASPE